MAIKESPECAAAARNPSLSHRCNNLVQRSVRLLGNQGKDTLAIVFQNRTATAARFRRTHPVITPALQPFDRRAGADLKALGRSEEHTSELQSLRHLVCRLLLEKKQ